jgi:hypothetical protein
MHMELVRNEGLLLGQATSKCAEEGCRRLPGRGSPHLFSFWRWKKGFCNSPVRNGPLLTDILTRRHQQADIVDEQIDAPGVSQDALDSCLDTGLRIHVERQHVVGASSVRCVSATGAKHLKTLRCKLCCRRQAIARRGPGYQGHS